MYLVAAAVAVVIITLINGSIWTWRKTSKLHFSNAHVPRRALAEENAESFSDDGNKEANTHIHLHAERRTHIQKKIDGDRSLKRE